MSALWSPNPIQKIPRIFQTLSRPAAANIPKFIISNILRIYSSGDIPEALNTYFYTTRITNKPLQSEIHHMVFSVRISAISFDVADIMKVMKCAKPSYMPKPDGTPPWRFRTTGPDLPLFMLNLFPTIHVSLFFVTVEDLHYWSHHKKCFMHEPENFRPKNYTAILFRFIRNFVKEQLVIFLTTQSLVNTPPQLFQGPILAHLFVQLHKPSHPWC